MRLSTTASVLRGAAEGVQDSVWAVYHLTPAPAAKLQELILICKQDHALPAVHRGTIQVHISACSALLNATPATNPPICALLALFLSSTLLLSTPAPLPVSLVFMKEEQEFVCLAPEAVFPAPPLPSASHVRRESICLQEIVYRHALADTTQATRAVWCVVCHV